MGMAEVKQALWKEERSDLISITGDLTVMGLVLSVVLYTSALRFDASEVVATCGFLACMAVIRVLAGNVNLTRFLWGKIFCVAVAFMFAWGLLYYAENTRAGWYRFNVLQHRVQQLVAKAPAYVITIDSDNIITGASNNIDLLCGYGREELIGKNANILMRAGPARRHREAVKKALSALYSDGSAPEVGWTLQGVITVGVRHKNGNIVPVKAYAGGIRWSQDIRYAGDTDIFAVFVPTTSEGMPAEPGTETQEAPDAPTTPSLIPLPHLPVDPPLPSNIARPGSQGFIEKTKP